MSRIVFIGLAGHGHTNPTLPLMQELVRRGHAVDSYNHETFRPQIEQTGARFHAYPQGELGPAEVAELLHGGNLAGIVLPVLRETAALLPHLLETLPQHRADLVVFDSLAIWGRMAADLLGLRTVSSITHFVFDVQHLMAEDSHSLRHLWQLLPVLPAALLARWRLSRRYPGAYPRERPLMPLRGGRCILFTVRDLQPQSAIIDETFRFVGPAINPELRGGELPFVSGEQDVVVYISLGTVHHARTEFYRECFAAFADYPALFVLSAGSEAAVEALGTPPDNFLVRPSVPQLALLQHADVFITHGGMNSLHEGLYYGLPLVVVPHQLEQLLNARCTEKAGAGLLLEGQMGGRSVTAAELRAALEQVLTRPQYRESAQALQRTLQAAGGYRRAADEIEAWLAGE